MRDFFAILAIIAAVVGLGVFRVPDENALIAAGLQMSAQSALLDVRHPVDITVDGREITARGRVESDAERQDILSRLRGLSGVEDVVDALDLLPEVSPFVLQIQKDDGYALSGHVPDQRLSQDLAGVLEQGVDLPPAVGAPDADWAAVAALGARALVLLLDGEMRLVDQRLTLRGAVHLPRDQAQVAAILAELPEAYDARLDLRVVDDGIPYSLHIRRDDKMGLRLQGKLPPEFDTAVFNDLGAAQEVALRLAPLPLDAPGFEEAVAAGLAGFAALPEGALTVAPGLVVLSGGEMTPEICRAIEGVQGSIPDGYELSTSFVAPDDGVELSVVVAKIGTDLVLTGHVPRDFSVDKVYAYLGGVGQDQTSRSPYPDLQGWSEPLWAGLTALAALEEGQVSLSADGLKITGVATNPESRQRARRALGVAGQLEVQLLDDGAPPAYVLEFDAGAGASLQGKLPSGLSVALMAEALGLEAIRGRVTVSPDGSETRTIALLTALRPILSYVEGLRVEMSATDLSLSVALTPGADPQMWRRALGLVPAQVTVSTAADAVLGARRAHLFRQESQVFAGGYWLPFVALLDQPEMCNAADVPDIPFEAQSFALGLDAVWPLAHLAAVARSCAGMAGLTLDLQAVATGYEAPALNAQLARRRAEAVRQALIARGVPGDRITAGSADGTGDQIRAIWR